jgi:hypothetical protein
MTTEFNDLAKEIHANAVEHGWWGKPVDKSTLNEPTLMVIPERNFGEVLALIHSEVSEALEAWRDGDPINMLYRDHPDGTRCENSSRCYGPKGTSEEAKPTGVPSELADIIIRVLDASAAYGVDIDEAILVKMAYNRTRPFLHGRLR